MKQINKPTEIFEVILSRAQVEYIRDFTQNSVLGEESSKQTTIRQGLFIGASRMLGTKMNDDGTISRFFEKL